MKTSNGQTLNLEASRVCAILASKRGSTPAQRALQARLASHYGRMCAIQFAIEDHADATGGALPLEATEF